jgi:hypothetical protein
MKTKLLILLLMTLTTLQIQDSFACSCSSYPDFLMVWMESSGAFQGTVKDILTGEGPRKVTFDIHQVQKGNFPYGDYTLGDSSIIYHGKDMIQMSSCSVDYKIGETYQVFTYSGNQIMGETNMCSTKQISGFDEGSHEDEDGQIQHYRQDYNFFTQYNLFSLIIPVSIAAIIVGIIIWRKRK